MNAALTVTLLLATALTYLASAGKPRLLQLVAAPVRLKKRLSR